VQSPHYYAIHQVCLKFHELFGVFVEKASNSLTPFIKSEPALFRIDSNLVLKILKAEKALEDFT
jgi:hypothetical protein